MTAEPVWMPHPGHYICARYCRFSLNTYINGYIVSAAAFVGHNRLVAEWARKRA